MALWKQQKSLFCCDMHCEYVGTHESHLDKLEHPVTVSSGRAKSISRSSCRMMKKMRKNLDRSIDFCRRLCPPRATSEWAMHFHFRHLPGSRVYDHCSFSFNDRILGQSMGNKFGRQTICSLNHKAWKAEVTISRLRSSFSFNRLP